MGKNLEHGEFELDRGFQGSFEYKLRILNELFCLKKLHRGEAVLRNTYANRVLLNKSTKYN